MSALRHTESSPGLAKGPYAKRYRVWPPKGFKEPTREELGVVLRRRSMPNLRKYTVDQLIRWMEIMEWFGATVHRTPGLEKQIVDFMHTVRREIDGRPDRRPYRSIRIHRCSMCSHASERVWEATGETHAITDRDDEPVKSAFVCARCWSDYLLTEED